MTNQLFDRVAVFTDIHFGRRNNDRVHNLDCEAFVNWFIETAHANNIDTCIFGGDWHDNRHSIHVSTLNYSLGCLETLSKNFKQIYFIPGNHDLFFKEKREISSISIARNLKNITLINELWLTGGVLFCPWLVGDEWKQIPNLAKNAKYVFGHFELPHFLMNAMVEMPEHGDDLSAQHFEEVNGLVFSGHFHKRQVKNNICYMGNTFPHTFADADDDDRGMMILQWGKDPEFIAWPKAPMFKNLKLSTLLEDPDNYLNERVHIKANSDINITYEEAQFLKETFIQHYNPRKIDISAYVHREEEAEFDEKTVFQSVDQMVIEGLQNIDSQNIDKKILIDLYRNLD